MKTVYLLASVIVIMLATREICVDRFLFGAVLTFMSVILLSKGGVADEDEEEGTKHKTKRDNL